MFKDSCAQFDLTRSLNKRSQGSICCSAGCEKKPNPYEAEGTAHAAGRAVEEGDLGEVADSFCSSSGSTKHLPVFPWQQEAICSGGRGSVFLTELKLPSAQPELIFLLLLFYFQSGVHLFAHLCLCSKSLRSFTEGRRGIAKTDRQR